MKAPLPNWNSSTVCSWYLLYFFDKYKKWKDPLYGQQSEYLLWNDSILSKTLYFKLKLTFLASKKRVKTLIK